MRFNELDYVWKLVKIVALTTGLLFSFFAVIELIRAFNTLYELNRFVGYGFLILLIICIVWFSWHIIISIISRPKVLTPPKIGDKHFASITELKRYSRYLEKYLSRLCANSHFLDIERNSAIEGLAKITQVNYENRSEQELLGCIQQTEVEIIVPLLSKLDAVAEREVQNCVRDIMIGVTLSPYRAVDLFIVLYRNAVMITNIIKIYNTRPHLREQLTIIKDVISVIAAVNFINFGSRFMEQLMSNVPYIGTIVDDMAQGIGSGLLTSATGHAALYRCRAFKGWNREESMKLMASKISQFFSDVNAIFRNDVLPSLRYKVASFETWEKISNGFASVFEKMSEIIKGFVRVPVPSNIGSMKHQELLTYEDENGLILIRKSPFSHQGWGVLSWVIGRVKERFKDSRFKV